MQQLISKTTSLGLASLALTFKQQLSSLSGVSRWGNINSPNIPYSKNGSHAKALAAAKNIYSQASDFADNTASDPTVPLGSAMAFIPTNNKQAMTS